MQAYLRKYGESTTIEFELFQGDGIDFRSNAIHEDGDSTIVLDSGAEEPTDNPFFLQGKGYGIVLSALEMQASRISLYIVDQSPTKLWLDRAFHIETYGAPAAQHAFDLDAENNSDWTQIIQESYASLGDEFTPAQALYMIMQTLSEFEIDGEVLRVRQRNRQTQAMQFALNDPKRATARTRVK